MWLEIVQHFFGESSYKNRFRSFLVDAAGLEVEQRVTVYVTGRRAVRGGYVVCVDFK